MHLSEEHANILRAVLNGQKLQVIDRQGPADAGFEITSFDSLLLFSASPDRYEVRIKPDVIIVNGIEVPAPEKTELPDGKTYWVAHVGEKECFSGGITWVGDETDKRWLSYGIVHTSPKAAAAHGKAMRAHKPG